MPFALALFPSFIIHLHCLNVASPLRCSVSFPKILVHPIVILTVYFIVIESYPLNLLSFLFFCCITAFSSSSSCRYACNFISLPFQHLFFGCCFSPVALVSFNVPNVYIVIILVHLSGAYFSQILNNINIL